MDREVIRVLIVVSLVFLLVGDFATFFAPFLQMVGLDGEDSTTGGPVTKAQSLRPGDGNANANSRNSRGGGTDDDNGDEDGDGVGMDDVTKASDLMGAASIAKSTLMATIRNSCLPKLICELNATPHRERLTDSERSLLGLIKDTTLSTTAEVTSKYHFAAHMGQLIAGIEGTGCHNFYPACPFPGLQVLQMMKKVRIR